MSADVLITRHNFCSGRWSDEYAETVFQPLWGSLLYLGHYSFMVRVYDSQRLGGWDKRIAADGRPSWTTGCSSSGSFTLIGESIASWHEGRFNKLNYHFWCKKGLYGLFPCDVLMAFNYCDELGKSWFFSFTMLMLSIRNQWNWIT